MICSKVALGWGDMANRSLELVLAFVAVPLSLCAAVPVGMRWVLILARELAVGAISVDVVLSLGMPVGCFWRRVAEGRMLGLAPMEETLVLCAEGFIFLPKDENPTRPPLVLD